jgi:hypothetical protein
MLYVCKLLKMAGEPVSRILCGMASVKRARMQRRSFL